MSIRKHWGEWPGQTVGIGRNGINYIRGYDVRDKLVKLTYTDKELDGLIESLINVRRRNNGKV